MHSYWTTPNLVQREEDKPHVVYLHDADHYLAKINLKKGKIKVVVGDQLDKNNLVGLAKGLEGRFGEGEWTLKYYVPKEIR